MPLVRGINRSNLCKSRDDSEIGLICSQTASSSSVVEDIDAADENMYECIVEYVDDVISDLREKEKEQHALINAIPKQLEDDRFTLMEWMGAIRADASLRLDTFALAVGILDRYINALLRENQNLPDPIIGIEHAVGAMMLAATLEETFPPDTRDMKRLCERKVVSEGGPTRLFYYCDETKLRTTSWKMGNALDFDLWTPTWLHFLRRFSKASRNTRQQHTYAKNVCLHLGFYYAALVKKYPPSFLAAVAIMITRINIMPDKKRWNRTLQHYTGYSDDQIYRIAHPIAPQL